MTFTITLLESEPQVMVNTVCEVTVWFELLFVMAQVGAGPAVGSWISVELSLRVTVQVGDGPWTFVADQAIKLELPACTRFGVAVMLKVALPPEQKLPPVTVGHVPEVYPDFDTVMA